MRWRMTRVGATSARSWLSAGFAAIAVLSAAGSARPDEPATAPNTTASRFFKICTGQTYALCAVASCFVLNGVSYCKCDVKSGDSISLPFHYDRGKDICTINAEGPANGYMVSTFSLPPSVRPPAGDKALYDCPAATSTGAYAQCDGGLCFTSTRGQSFPGLAAPLRKDEIICSCPITVANPASLIGYQIAGPYPCQKSFFRYCKKAVANNSTGATIYVGAPTGVPRLLTRLLYGFVPPFNRCH